MKKIRTVFVRPGISYSLIFDCFRFLIFGGVFDAVKLCFDSILTTNYFCRFSLDFTDFFAKCLCHIHGAYVHISPRALKIVRFSMPFFSLFPAFWRRSAGGNGAQFLRRLAQPTGTREKTFGSGRDVRAAGCRQGARFAFRASSGCFHPASLRVLRKACFGSALLFPLPFVRRRRGGGPGGGAPRPASSSASSAEDLRTCTPFLPAPLLGSVWSRSVSIILAVLFFVNIFS